MRSLNHTYSVTAFGAERTSGLSSGWPRCHPAVPAEHLPLRAKIQLDVRPFTFASRQWAYGFDASRVADLMFSAHNSHDFVVKQHGGTIDIETRANEFTDFIVTLPRQAIE
jgi:hypothetical protein